MYLYASVLHCVHLYDYYVGVMCSVYYVCILSTGCCDDLLYAVCYIAPCGYMFVVHGVRVSVLGRTRTSMREGEWHVCARL